MHARQWYDTISFSPADLSVADPGVGRMFDERVYKRGALTLHALRGELGEERFFALLKAWTSEHRHGTVSTADFIGLAQSFAGRSLGDFFTTWLENPALPAFRG
jgi:aminopeptidase N